MKKLVGIFYIVDNMYVYKKIKKIEKIEKNLNYYIVIIPKHLAELARLKQCNGEGRSVSTLLYSIRIISIHFMYVQE